MMPQRYTPLGYQYIDRSEGLSAEDAEASTFEELVAGAEETIADIERAITRQVPASGWWGPSGRVQVALPGDAAAVPAEAPSRFPWGLAIGAVVVGGGLIYLATRKG